MAQRQSPITQYLYQGKKLSKQKQQYNREVKNLYRRAKSWEKQYGFKVDLESMLTAPPKRDITKHAVKLREIRKVNLTDIDQKQKEYVEAGYVDTWEQVQKYHYRGAPLAMFAMMHPEQITPEIYAKYPEIQEVLRPRPREKPYKPRTEQEYYNDEPEEDEFEGYEWYGSEPVIEEAEIEARLTAIFADMVDWYPQVDRDTISQSTIKYREQMAKENADKVAALWRSAENSLGKAVLYNRLKDPAVVDRITSIAHALYNIPSDDKYGSISAGYLTSIATILNAGPLSQEQAESMTMYGVIDFDLYDNEF